MIRGPFPRAWKPSKTRTVKVPQVMWAKVTGADVLEGRRNSRCRHPHRRRDGRGGISARIVPIQRDPVCQRPAADVQLCRLDGCRVTSAQLAPFIVSTAQIKGGGYLGGNGDEEPPVSAANPDTEAGMPQRINPPVASQAPPAANADGGGEHQAHRGSTTPAWRTVNGPTGGPFWRGKREARTRPRSVPTTWSGHHPHRLHPHGHDPAHLRHAGSSAFLTDSQENGTINKLVMTAQGPTMNDL